MAEFKAPTRAEFDAITRFINPPLFPYAPSSLERTASGPNTDDPIPTGR